MDRCASMIIGTRTIRGGWCLGFASHGHLKRDHPSWALHHLRVRRL